MPAIPAVPSGARSVADFGARPNDNTDDTTAIQNALDSLQSGQTLVFPAGRYLTNKKLRVRVAGVSLRGKDATLHATNPDDMALVIEQDNVSVYQFRFTAVTDGRRTAPWHSRIAVTFQNPDKSYKVIRNTVIQGNVIAPADNATGRERNASSAGGIMLMRADKFLVAGNTVKRTLADGIHITMGSRNGRVIHNTVRETGDDMIAVVSYAGSGTPALNTVGKLKQNWATRVEQRLARNIVVRNNTVGGQYWGRGITVIGGQNVTIRDNRLDNIPLAAGILLAREANYESFGVNDVMVQGNTLSNIQTQSSPYDPDGTFAGRSRTGHGAIEIHGSLFQDEAADAQMKEELSIRKVKVVDNYIHVTSVPAVRAGIGFSGSMRATDPNSGAVVVRPTTTGTSQNLSVQRSEFNSVPGEPMTIRSGVASSTLHCKENKRDGQPYSNAACGRPTDLTVVGATLSCSGDGKTL